MSQRILVPKDRIVSRGQGCWNCIHGNSANEFWTERRKSELVQLKILTDENPNSETRQRLAHKIDVIDHSVAAGALKHCTKGVTAAGEPVGDLVAHNYLCSKWSGQQGASLAREGGKLDELPEELIDKVDGTPSLDLEKLVGKKLIEN